LLFEDDENFLDMKITVCLADFFQIYKNL